MSQAWLPAFIEHLTATGNISGSAAAAGISSATVYRHKREDADFSAAWDQAIEDSVDTLQAEARRRALRGVEEPVVYQGQLTPVWQRHPDGTLVMEEYDLPYVVGVDPAKLRAQRPIQAIDPDGRPLWLTVTRYSDALMALLLKGLRKKVFADRTELTGADGGPVVMDETTRLARVAQIMALAESRAAIAEEHSDLA